LSESKKKAGILGAGGFTGIELLSILSKHEYIEVVYATSSEYKGRKVTNVMPYLESSSLDNLEFSKHPESAADLPKLDLIFLAAPDEVSIKFTPLFLKENIKVIDISGAFRISDDNIFESYYGLKRNDKETLEKAVYGIPEINREKIKSARLIANPGCYPTATIAPLWFMKDFLKEIKTPIFIDAKSGTSGAGGRKEKDTLPFSGVHENFRAYKVGMHQHEPEISQEVQKFLNNAEINFTPHLLPLFRGIQSAAYFGAEITTSPDEIKEIIKEKIKDEPFIRMYSSPNDIELKNVQNTNFLDFSFHYDEKKKIMTIISSIDNLQKGAAGQAVQNMNLLFNFQEAEALY